MNKCKTCRYWADIDAAMRGCLRVEDFHDQEKPDLFAVGEACDRYGDPEYPCVITGPDFGCVHWEAKQ